MRLRSGVFQLIARAPYLQESLKFGFKIRKLSEVDPIPPSFSQPELKVLTPILPQTTKLSQSGALSTKMSSKPIPNALTLQLSS